ncbi:hypothetical protein KCU87_g23, partial [Aureobasidium melanogenum]
MISQTALTQNLLGLDVRADYIPRVPEKPASSVNTSGRRLSLLSSKSPQHGIHSFDLQIPPEGSSSLPRFSSTIQGVVYQQAVSVNTFVQSNTTFFPHPEAQAITVTDAPTSFNLITTLSWTKTFSYTASASAVVSAAISTTTDSPFIF